MAAHEGWGKHLNGQTHRAPSIGAYCFKGFILGSTIAEKILARASGQTRVNAGDNIKAKPDFVVAYDFPGYTDVIFKQMKDEFGLTGVKDPSRYALFIDHMVPAVTPQEEELHQNTRDWGAQAQVPVYERKGIGHQVASELGYATPGAFVVHFDGHMIESFVNEKIRMAVQPPHGSTWSANCSAA